MPRERSRSHDQLTIGPCFKPDVNVSHCCRTRASMRALTFSHVSSPGSHSAEAKQLCVRARSDASRESTLAAAHILRLGPVTTYS
jgi:hypothetical protein